MEQQKQLHLIMEWDLQWFAKDGPGGEKTEPATAKKLREAREDGKVVKSKELTAAFDLIILFLVLKIFVSFVGNRLMNSFVDIYGRIPDFVRENAVDVTEKSVAALMSDALIQILIVCVPFFAFGFVVTALISVIQVGWKVTGKPLQPKFDKFNPINGFKKAEGDRFLNEQFTGKYCEQGYVKRLRKSYDKRMNELNEVLKTVITSLSITAVIAIVTVATAGALAGPIAVALVGSNFAGLSGAALTSACLAYLGGGAIAAGGAGMLGGTIAIVGGGAALGIGVGAGVGGAVGSVGLMGKKNTIMQSAKLLTSVREIFLNDEHDIEFSNSVYEQYLQNITEIEKGLVELRLKKDVAKGKEKKAIAETIKKAEESVEAMKVARKSMLKYNSSFSEGLQVK